MKKVIETAANRARGLLELNRDILDRGARLLLEKETLGEPDIKNLMVNTKMPFEGQEISWNLC
jgi:ATP-dependent Zn protease